MKKTFYITTPIYYPSANPHVGTAYTTVLADVLAKYKRLVGYDAFLTTGTDEHALKILINAKRNNLDPQTFVDQFSAIFSKLWKALDIDVNSFIRTTDKKHIQVVQHVYEQFNQLNLLELKQWHGYYCNSCEENYAMNNIVQKDDGYYCNQNHKLVDKSEDSLFFKLSLFTNWIKEFLFEIKPDFIYPVERRNEIFNNFIKNGLEDLSVSRIDADWGIPVLENNPLINKQHHVAYVWIDALFSYLSALNYLQKDDANYQKYWNNENVEIIHLMSKEIVRFHAIFWPIFLHVLRLNLPSKIISHGWIVTPEGKMSKSLGNVIDPYEYINKYGTDALRFFFIKGLILENDSIFSEDRFIEIYNTYLANTFGNLASRTHSMLKKYFNGTIPNIQQITYYQKYYDLLTKTKDDILAAVEQNNLNAVIDLIFEINMVVNAIIEQEKPWELFKNQQIGQLNEFLHLLVNINLFTYYFLSPILTKGAKTTLWSFGFDLNHLNVNNILDFMQINNHQINEWTILYQRIVKK